MKLTRNTKLYKATDRKNSNVVYKTLTVTELAVIDRVKNPLLRAELAYDLGYISGDCSNFFSKYQIGMQIIQNSTTVVSDDVLFELTIDEMRNSVKSDFVLSILTQIVSTFPGTSIEYLFSLNTTDLIELGALCEVVTNKKIFNVGNKPKPQNTVADSNGNNFFSNDGKSLQEQMKELNGF
jgi:hypothetical protein